MSRGKAWACREVKLLTATKGGDRPSKLNVFFFRLSLASTWCIVVLLKAERLVTKYKHTAYHVLQSLWKWRTNCAIILIVLEARFASDQYRCWLGPVTGNGDACVQNNTTTQRTVRGAIWKGGKSLPYLGRPSQLHCGDCSSSIRKCQRRRKNLNGAQT